MIDLNIYPELIKLEKQKVKIKKRCNKIEREEERAIGHVITLERSLQISEPVRDFETNVISEAIFKIMQELNPEIIENRTGKHFKFTEVFGNSFEKIDKRLRFQLYLMTMEGPAIYKYWEDVNRLNGRIIEGGEFDSRNAIGCEAAVYRNGEIVDYGYQFGISLKDFYKIDKQKRIEDCTKWQKMSDYERAEHMNQTYGFNYNPDDFSKERRD